MAVLGGTFQTTSSTTNRETLSDIVSRITPQDTPIYSMIGKDTAEGVHPEWVIDTLASPGSNIQLEGDEYSFSSTTAPSRVGNYTQIMRKTWILSETQEKVSEAGRVLKRKETKLKRGIELRKDVEFAIVAAQASVAGATRQLGSLSTWLTSNVSRGATGANGGFSSGTGLTVAPTNGTQRAFTKALMDTVMQSGYQSGANFGHIVCSPYVKSVFVTFMSDTNVASFRYAVSGTSKNTIVATADVYEGPFGKVLVHPNRVMAGAAAQARNVFFLDTEYLSFMWLRKIAEDTEAAGVKTGDAKKGVLIGEGTLKVKNEAGLGVVADVFGLTSST